MPFVTRFDSDYYLIEANIEENLLRSKWLRHVSHDELVDGGTKLYEILAETGIERAVANAEALGTLTAPSKDWLSSRFYELLSQTSLKKLARVLPGSVFHQIALESVVTRAEALGVTRFDVKNFSRQSDALDWLLN